MMRDGSQLDHDTGTLPPLLTVMAALDMNPVIDAVEMSVAVSQHRRVHLVTDDVMIRVTVSQHGGVPVWHAEAPDVTVDVCEHADLGVTGPGSPSVPGTEPDVADPQIGDEAATEAAAASVTRSNAGRLKGPSCLRGLGSHPNRHWGRKSPVAQPWSC